VRRFCQTTVWAVAAIGLLALMAAPSRAAAIYYRGMDYGGTTGLWKDNAAATSDFSTTSIRHRYEASGLSHANLAVTGGNYAYVYTDGASTITDATSFNPDFESASPGDTYWIAMLAQWAGTDSQFTVNFNHGNSVDRVGFRILVDGTVEAYGSDNGGGADYHNTGKTAVAGQTHLLLMRGTFGAGDSSVRNSTLDFWFDPADVSSEGALGAADWTTGGN